MSVPTSPGPPLAPITLEGRRVWLVPMEAWHVAALAEAGADPRIWELG